MKGIPPVGFLVFSLAMVAVAALPKIVLPCPIDGGTGILNVAEGITANNVTATYQGIKAIYTFSSCGSPVRWYEYTYSINLSLNNPTSHDSSGRVQLEFTPLFGGNQHLIAGAGEGEDTMLVAGPPPPVLQTTNINVPAGATKDVIRLVTFPDQKYDNVPTGVAIHSVAVVTGAYISAIPDPVCGGTGKLSFIDWLQALRRK